MLQFFRKYQRYFFIFTTVIIVISFSFFGTFSTFLPERKAEDKIAFIAIDDSKVMQSEKDAFVRFLSSGLEDRALFEMGRMPNLLSDSILYKDFLKTGMGEMLASRYFEELKPDFEEKLKKAKSYKGYVHPQAPFLSAQQVWQTFSPEMNLHLAQLKAQDDQVTLEVFRLFSDLYEDQATFPPDVLKRILMYQQNQYSWVKPDARLQEDPCTLFGFLSIEEWFGQKYLDLIAQFMINASILAEQRGYQISDAEAKQDLLHNAKQSMKALFQKDDPSDAEVAQFFYQQLKFLGMTDTDAIKIWRKALLFRRIFNESGESIIFDPLLQKQMASYADQSVSVDLYELPSMLRVKDFKDLMKVQCYIDAVSLKDSKKRFSSLLLPNQFPTPQEIEMHFPELIQEKMTVEFLEVDQQQLTERISLKETWEWELEESHFELIKKQFPELNALSVKTRDERFLFLDKLDSSMRLKIDKYAREQIVLNHPEWLDEAFHQAAVQTVTLGIRKKGGELPFQGIKDREALYALLKSAPLKTEVTEKEKFVPLTQDGQHHYRLAILNRSQEKEILTFAEAEKDRTLDALLDKRLEEAYPEVRRREPSLFQNKDGTWKPFQEVKEEIASHLYADLLKMLEESQRSSSLFKNEGEAPRNFYAKLRFYDQMQQIKRDLEVQRENSLWVRGENEKADNFSSQWKLVKSTKEFKRSGSSSIFTEELFSLPEGSWSSVNFEENGNVAFFHVLKRFTQEDTSELTSKGHQLLSLDAKRCFMEELLDLMQSKNALSLAHE